jgi:hypothetical protein
MVPELLRQRVKLGVCWDTGKIGDEAQDTTDSVSSFAYKKPHYGAGQGHPDADLCWPCEFVFNIQISPPAWHMAAKFWSSFMVNVLQG